jgi:alanyl-tRNA synthetase
MKSMTSAQVRQAFLDYFEEMQHQPVASSSLVPANDPTLLFANAGMVQFKDVFLGLDQRDYKRATTSQKCMRVSGKHNDLENVGPSPRHHTFFEMLGNFSFGDYFKRDAIRFAYDLLTKVYELPADRLVFTVYENDDEAYSIWVDDIGVDPKRVARMGPSTNFWQMADTGPCGPTSEIHWDKTPDMDEDTIIPMLIEEDDRFLEIWNLVFMQFNRQQADPEHTGEFDLPLPAPGVDTGMGLERIVSIMQDKEANYETDLFMPIIEATQAFTGHSDEERDANIVPYRVIADHVRAAVFLIADGVLPGAKGRDSVCRLVIRRAARFGTKIGFDAPFLGTVAKAVIETMGDHYTELKERAEAIQRTITREEERFHRTMERGIEELDTMLAGLPENGTLSGEQAFYLKATLGLPIQVTKDIVEERGYQVDISGFETAEEEHSKVSGGGQAMGKIDAAELYRDMFEQLQQNGQISADGVNYLPYNDDDISTQVVALLSDGELIGQANVGDMVEIITQTTNFYVESGGQVSDTGTLTGENWVIEITGMKKPIGGIIVHMGEVVEGNPQVGTEGLLVVDRERRMHVMRNHTATHLLHAALRNHLGTHVQQRGSLVAPDRLRFDFSHDERVTEAEMRVIEDEVNAIIQANLRVRDEEKSLEQARKEGAMALFGEKYGDVVRTVIIDDGDERYSYELCGGTHVKATGDIEGFVFTSEGSVSAGIRRIEAITGDAVRAYYQERLQVLDDVVTRLNTTEDNVVARIQQLQQDLSDARKQVDGLQRKLARHDFKEMVTQTENINGKTALLATLDNVPVDTMREMADWFRTEVPENGVMVLGSDIQGKPMLLVALTDDLVKAGMKAGNLIKPIAAVVGGGGGGRPNMAQAGGKDSAKLPEAIDKAREILSDA